MRSLPGAALPDVVAVPSKLRRPRLQAAQVARWPTRQTVAATTHADSASNQPPSVHSKDQSQLGG